MNDLPTNQTLQSLLSRMNPAVPRRYLFVLAGGLWTIAGTVLCLRAEVWLEVLPMGTEIELEVLGAILAVPAYLFLFMHIVRRSIDRITDLPERVCLFAFTAWRGYLLIALMIGLGLALRSTSIPGYWFSLPYTAMGIVLIVGSLQFYRQFLIARAGQG
ncbi:MAG TPA: hypothetical protein DEP53_02365 [Bacteroidetes bacterium]|nr:hypothetical protein [Bacteroidota bacterium]